MYAQANHRRCRQIPAVATLPVMMTGGVSVCAFVPSGS